MAKSVWEKVKEEFLKLIPPTVFFFVTLHIIALIRSLMTRGSGIEPSGSASVLIAALILGKAVLIADLIPAINRFPEKPLIYNVTWKTFLYVIVATALHYLENLFEFWRKADSLAAANQDLIAHIVWPRFLAIEILIFFIVALYVTMSELVRLIGVDNFKRMFFGPVARPPAKPVPS